MRFIDIPCGKNQGHGEFCCKERMCDQCSEILELRERIRVLEKEAKHKTVA